MSTLTGAAIASMSLIGYTGLGMARAATRYLAMHKLLKSMPQDGSMNQQKVTRDNLEVCREPSVHGFALYEEQQTMQMPWFINVGMISVPIGGGSMNTEEVQVFSKLRGVREYTNYQAVAGCHLPQVYNARISVMNQPAVCEYLAGKIAPSQAPSATQAEQLAVINKYFDYKLDHNTSIVEYKYHRAGAVGSSQVPVDPIYFAHYKVGTKWDSHTGIYTTKTRDLCLKYAWDNRLPFTMISSLASMGTWIWFS